MMVMNGVVNIMSLVPGGDITGKHTVNIKQQPQLAWHMRYTDEDAQGDALARSSVGLTDSRAPGDVEMGHGEGGADTSMPAAADNEDEKEPVGPELAFFRKFKQLSTATTVCLQIVSSSQLSADFVKESNKHLKNLMLKLTKARVGFLHCPYKHFLERTDEMVAAIASTQAFLKAATSYFKKFDNTSEVHRVSEDFVAWVKKHHITMCTSVEVLLTKASVRDLCDKGHLPEKNALTDPKFLQLVRASAKETRRPVCSLASEWLEDVFHDSFITGRLEGDPTQEELTDDICSELSSMAKVFVESAQHVQSSLISGPQDVEAFSDTLTTINAVKTLCLPAQDRNFADIDNAIEYLERPCARRIRTSLTQHHLGQLLWAAAVEMRSVGCMDSQAVSTLAFSTGILRNENLGKCSAGDDQAGVWTFTTLQVAGGKVPSLMYEALDSAMMSLQQYSSAGLQAAVKDLKCFVDLFVERLYISNLLEWWQLSQCLSVVQEPWAEYYEDDPEASVFVDLDLDTFAGVAASFSEQIEKHNFSTGAFFNLLSRIDDQREKLELLMRQVTGLDDSVGTLLQLVPQFLADVATRTRIAEEGERVCSLLRAPRPTTPSQVVDQINSGGFDRSMLGIACRLHEVRKGERTVCKCMSEKTLGLKIVLNIDDDVVSEISTASVTAMVEIVGSGFPLGAYLVQKCSVGFFASLCSVWTDRVSDVLGCTFTEEGITTMAQQPGPVKPNFFFEKLDAKVQATDIAAVFEKTKNKSSSLEASFDTLPVQILSTILCRLVDVVPMDFLKQLVPRGADEDEAARSATRLFVQVACTAGQLLQLAAWLQTRFDSEATVLLKSISDAEETEVYTVQPDLKRSYDMFVKKLHEQMDETPWSVPVPSFGDDDDECVEQAFRTAEGTAPPSMIITSLSKVWLPAFTSSVLAVLSEKLAVISKATHTLSPTWSFFIDNDKYNNTLAKKQLLTTAVLETLPKQMGIHHGFLVEISALCEQWALGKAEDHPLLKPALAESKEFFEYGQKTVSVSQAVYVLEKVAKSSRKAAAAECLTLMQADFPMSLKKLVQKLARS